MIKEWFNDWVCQPANNCMNKINKLYRHHILREEDQQSDLVAGQQPNLEEIQPQVDDSII